MNDTKEEEAGSGFLKPNEMWDWDERVSEFHITVNGQTLFRVKDEWTAKTAVAAHNASIQRLTPSESGGRNALNLHRALEVCKEIVRLGEGYGQLTHVIAHAESVLQSLQAASDGKERGEH